MKNFLTALKTYYDGANGAALRAVNTGGFWLVHGKDDIVPPYVVGTFVAAIREHTMEDNSAWEVVGMQMSIFVDDFQVDTGLEIRDLLVATFDNISFAYTGGRLIHAYRTLTGVPIRDPDEGYIIPVDYNFLLDQ